MGADFEYNESEISKPEAFDEFTFEGLPDDTPIEKGKYVLKITDFRVVPTPGKRRIDVDFQIAEGENEGVGAREMFNLDNAVGVRIFRKFVTVLGNRERGNAKVSTRAEDYIGKEIGAILDMDEFMDGARPKKFLTVEEARGASSGGLSTRLK